MSCSTEFISAVTEILSPLGEVRTRMMMGDYVVYLNDKLVATACDNTLYVKQLPAIAQLMTGAEVGAPYPGAKPQYVLPLTDPQHTRRVITALAASLPAPKPRRKPRR